MKNLNRLFVSVVTLAFIASSAFADDFDGFGDFGSFDGDSSVPKLETNGSISTDIRAYTDADTLDEVELKASPSARIDMKYSGNKSDIELKLNVDDDKTNDVIDELVVRGYFGNLVLEAGKMKTVRGKGDKLHVTDNFNADDYSDFIIPDYIDRRISTPMLRGVYSFPVANIQLEGVYTPFLPVDRFAASGRWTPAQVSALSEKVTSIAEGKLAESYTRYTKASVTAGTLKTLGAEYQAAATAYETVLLNAAASQTVAASGGNWNAMTDEQKAAFIEANKTALSAGAAANKTALEAGLRTSGYGYYIDNLAVAEKTYFAACTETGFTAETIDAELTAAGTEYMYCLANANALSANANVIYPDMMTLKYGQFGGRLTATLGQVDLGVSYYNGWYKQPSINADKMNSFVESYLKDGSVTEDEKFLAYDKKQTFGIEASSVIWHFNVRGEAAYNLTEDTDGTNPYVHNNSAAWLAGFDIDLPFWNANLTVQETGTYILHGEECNKSTLDVDYSENAYTNNKVVCNFTTSFANDKIAPEVTVLYGIENGDLVILPKVSVKPDQNLTLSASGMYIWCKDSNSEFVAWKDNSFVTLGAEYRF